MTSHTSTPKTFQYPIVGTKFHPPADTILANLAVGTELILRAEPSNRFDPNAIMVLIDTQHVIGNERLERQLSSAQVVEILGLQWFGLWFHLGYLPRAVAAHLRYEHDFPIKGDVDAKFTVLATSNQPHVSFDL